MQRPTLNSFLLFVFIISSPVLVLAQFYPFKISNNKAIQKADSVYSEYIKNSSKVKQTEIPVVKFDEKDKINAVEIADSKYSEWLKKSSNLKQLEIPVLKFDEMDKTSALVNADSRYLEYIKKADNENDKQIKLASAKFDDINKISVVEIADSKYFKTPIIIIQDLKASETLASNKIDLINTDSNKESLNFKNEIVESDESTKKEFLNTEINLDQQQSIEIKAETKILLSTEKSSTTEPLYSTEISSNLTKSNSNLKTSNNSKWKTDIPVTEEQAENISNGFYVVNEGETLYRVAVNTKLSVDKIKALNSLNNNNINPGTKLIISNTKSESTFSNKGSLSTKNNSKWKTDIPVTEEQAENISNGFYVVNEGETLYRVSVNTNLSIDKLKALNNLKNNNVYPGTKLIIK